MHLHQTIEAALHQKGHVTSRDLQRALGISRQAAWVHVRRLLDAGVLVASGAARGTRYVPGPRLGGTPVHSTDLRTLFWNSLTEQFPRLAFVCVAVATRAQRRRSDAHALMISLGRCDFLVLDFEGIPRIGEPFARALVCEPPQRFGLEVVAINAAPAVRRTLDRVQALEPARWAGYD